MLVNLANLQKAWTNIKREMADRFGDDTAEDLQIVEDVLLLVVPDLEVGDEQ